MQSEDADDPSVVPDTDRFENPEVAVLEESLALERVSLAAADRAFVLARQRFDDARRKVRELEAELERRRTKEQDRLPAVPQERTRRKRSTTGVDALLGRDGVDPDRPLFEFRFLSLQRQEILLAATRERTGQRLVFTDPDSGAPHQAVSFGEARRLHDLGYTQGRPKDPLQRHDVWYMEEDRPGRLRLDQIFVEQDVEGL